MKEKEKRGILRGLLVLGIMFVYFISCGTEDTSPTVPADSTSPPAVEEETPIIPAPKPTTSTAQVDVVYNDLVWSDEFTSDGTIDSRKWFHQIQLPAGGNWFNNELQHYTNLKTNSYTKDGYLNIVAKKEGFTDQGVTKQYTSARLNSKFAYLYGRVDVRAKIPIAAGSWPAIWMLGKNTNEDGGFFDSTFGTVNWPASGEIDIMEHGITISHPINYIQSALHTPSSSGNTSNIGGVVSGTDIETNFHVYSMNWSPNEISFMLDEVVYYTYKPAVKNSTTWPFDKEQYLLLNIAMGGVAGAISSDFTETSMVIDYVRVFQNTAPDNQEPTNFTATIGAITGYSVELLLNAIDNSGTVAYEIAYGNNKKSIFSPSNVQKSLIIADLSPNTNYVFSVSASDLKGNKYHKNPIILNVTTTNNIITECAGTNSEATQGLFSVGYKYNFITTGSEVKITFELLDTEKSGVVAYLWSQNPFSEMQMSNISGKIFTKTISGQITGSTINYAVKFAYTGGMSVTKYISYEVGSVCK